MGRRLIALAVACAAFACAAGPAAAMPSPYPRYDNRSAPVLADGQQHGAEGGGGTVTPPSGAPEGGTTASCRKAKKKVRRARRKVKALKRKLRRGRTRALSRKLRTWKRKLKRAKRGARRRCAAATATGVPARRPGPATAAGHSGAYHRSGLILCDGNQLYMYAGPDMRSMSPDYVQGVAFRVAVFRWTGSRWAYVTEEAQYFWGTAGYSSPPYEYYDESGQRGGNQGFTINQAGSYRMAVRYHWWPNSRGGRTGTAWHWGGAHTYLQSGARAEYCTYG